MTRAALLLAITLGACGGAHPAPPSNTSTPETITLHYVPRAVGDHWTNERTMAMDMTIHADGQDVPMTGNEHIVKLVEVLAVADNAVSKAKVTYATYDTSQKIAGQEKEKPPTIAGKTYTIEAGAPLVVTTDAGPASAEETAEVQKKERHFGKPDPMDQMLDGKTFTRGEAVVLPSDELSSLADDPAMTIEKVTLTYQGMQGDGATFDMALQMTEREGAAMLEFALSGPVVVDPTTNRMLHSDLSGSVTMTGAAAAEGTMRMTETESP